MTIRVLSFHINPLMQGNQAPQTGLGEYSAVYTLSSAQPDEQSIIEAISRDMRAKFDPFRVESIWQDLSGAENRSAASSTDTTQAPKDESFLLTLYAQIQKIACEHPTEVIEFEFYAETPVLLRLRAFFTTYPDMIPDHVHLRLHSQPEPFAQRSELLPFIQGSGSIDWNYHETVMDMAGIAGKTGSLCAVDYVIPGENLLRKDPSVTRQMQCALNEIRETDVSFSGHMKTVAHALQSINLHDLDLNDQDLVNTAIETYNNMSQPTDLWQVLIPANIKTCTQREINQFFIQLDCLTRDTSISGPWTDRIKHYFWVTCHLEQLNRLVTGRAEVVRSIEACLQQRNVAQPMHALISMPFQRLTKLPLFTDSWSKNLGNGFLPEGHPVLHAVSSFKKRIDALVVQTNQAKKAQDFALASSKGIDRFDSGLMNHAEMADQLIKPLQPAKPLLEDEPIHSDSFTDVSLTPPTSPNGTFGDDDSFTDEDPGVSAAPEAAILTQNQLASHSLACLKSTILTGIANHSLRVYGGLFAGTALRLDDGTTRKVPAHISLLMRQIRRAEADDSVSLDASRCAIKIGLIAASSPHSRRARATRGLYDSILDTMSVDVDASLVAIENAIVSKNRDYWQTRRHERPATVNTMLALVQNRDMAANERLKQVLVLDYQAERSNGKLFNWRSRNTEDFYASLWQCLVLKSQPQLANQSGLSA